MSFSSRRDLETSKMKDICETRQICDTGSLVRADLSKLTNYNMTNYVLAWSDSRAEKI